MQWSWCLQQLTLLTPIISSWALGCIVLNYEWPPKSPFYCTMKWLISHRSSDNSHRALEAHGAVLVSDSFHIVLGAEIWLTSNCVRSWLTLCWSESWFESGWLTLECIKRWFTHCFLLIPIVAIHFGLYYAGIWLLCSAGTVTATLCQGSPAVVPACSQPGGAVPKSIQFWRKVNIWLSTHSLWPWHFLGFFVSPCFDKFENSKRGVMNLWLRVLLLLDARRSPEYFKTCCQFS